MGFEISKNENSFEGEGFEIDEKSLEYSLIKSEQFKIFGEDDFSEKMEFGNILNELNESMTQNNKEIENEKEKIEKWKNEFEKESIKDCYDILENKFIKEFHKKWENKYGKKFDEIGENKDEENFDSKFIKKITLQKGFNWSSYFDSYLKKNINYYFRKFNADINYKFFKNFCKTPNEFLMVFVNLFIAKILMKNKTNEIIQKIKKEIEKLSLDIYPINYIKDIIKTKFLEKMIYNWKQIFINKSLIEEIIKIWILEKIMEKQNEIRTKKDWDNTLLDVVLLIINGESTFYCILIDIKISLKCEKEMQKEERQNAKEDSKNICFFIKNKKIGYNMKTNTSSRYDNQMNKIISHLIQNIFLEWINNGETDESKLLRKIDSEVLKEKNYNFKGNTLKEIYSELKSKKKTSVKKQKDLEHNKELIANCKDEIKNKKLEMKFEQALYYFLCKKDGSTNKNINNLDENEDNILEGLIGKETYLNRIEGDASYKQQLLKILERIKKKYIPNLI